MARVEVNQDQDNLEVDVRLTKLVTVLSGQNLKRGQVVSISSGKVSRFATGQTPYTVLLEDADATSADVVGVRAVYDGYLSESNVDYNTGDADEVRDVLAQNNVFLVK